MVYWKDMLRLEWTQMFGRRRRRPHGEGLFQKGSPVKILPPRAQVMRDLEAARLRHIRHIARQRLYHGARTNCRWHESRHSSGA